MSAKLLTRLRTAVGGDPAPDRDLLRAFLAERSEPAFAELVRRHGPMVLGVCRRVLGNAHDADDAFQAAFLVLARKARSVAQPDRLPGWLHAVAVRTATEVRRMRDRRRQREQASGRREPAENALPRPAHAGRSPEQSELAALLDEELARLPEHYRLAVVLCELEGRPRKESATRLGIPEGTLSSRLAKAKRLLADRLTKRGVTATAATVAAVLGQAAAARVPGSRVIELASLAPASLSAVATHTAEGVVKAMFVTKLLKGLTATVGALAIGLSGAALVPGTAPGTGGAGHGVASAAEPTADEPAKLVQQLGSPSFAARHAAEKKLRELGAAAIPALRTGRADADPEIARRCEALLDRVRADGLRAFADAFRADEAGTQRFTHPLWQRFVKITGDTPPARKLFAEIIADPRRVDLLGRVEAEPKRAAAAYYDEVRRIANNWVPPRIGQKLDQSARNRNYRPTAGEVAAFLFLGTYPGTGLRGRKDSLESNAVMAINFSANASLMDDLFHGPLAAPLRRLTGVWFDRRENPDGMGLLGQFAQYDIPELLPTARRVAADKKLPQYLRLSVLQVLTEYGDMTDLPAFAPFYDVTKEAFTAPITRFGGTATRTITGQVRDLAVGLALRLSGQEPSDFGFPTVTEMGYNPKIIKNWKQVGNRFDHRRYGFFDNESRESAHKMARAFLNKQKQKK